jgi:alcohol dehydrogenase
MRALVFAAERRLEWHDRPELAVQGDLEAIVRPIASTTCDLDRRILTGRSPFAPPFDIGHECVAEVLAIGDKVGQVKPGDVVVVPWHVACGTCPACARGLPAHCEVMGRLSGYGVPIAGEWGGLFSEEVRVPFADGMLVPVPEGLDPAAVASASDNLTDAYIGVRRGLAKHPGARVLVVAGVESLGLFAADHALAAGAAGVDYVDADAGRRTIAESLGARVFEALDPGFDRQYRVVIGASREPADLRGALMALAPGGHCSNLAMFVGDTPMPLWEMYLRDVSFSIGLPSVGGHIPEVLKLAKCGHIHPERVMRVIDWSDACEGLLEPHLKPVMVRPRRLA